eukprot:16368862-Heterocapsa_arctica.AAC.1
MFIFDAYKLLSRDTQGPFNNQEVGDKPHRFPLCQQIYAFTIGIFVLLDEIERIQIERIHAKRNGIPWDISQGCDYIKQRCQNTHAHYMVALLLGSIRLTVSTAVIHHDCAWTDYCLVLSGQWIHGTRAKNSLPSCWDTKVDQAVMAGPPTVGTNLKTGHARQEY